MIFRPTISRSIVRLQSWHRQCPHCPVDFLEVSCLCLCQDRVMTHRGRQNLPRSLQKFFDVVSMACLTQKSQIASHSMPSALPPPKQCPTPASPALPEYVFVCVCVCFLFVCVCFCLCFVCLFGRLNECVCSVLGVGGGPSNFLLALLWKWKGIVVK